MFNCNIIKEQSTGVERRHIDFVLLSRVDLYIKIIGIMQVQCIYALFYILNVLFFVSHAYKYDATFELHRKLFNQSTYDKLIRPKSVNNATSVVFVFEPFRMVGIDEISESMDIQFKLTFVWHDLPFWFTYFLQLGS